ncbi:hypothetical protein [Thermococcus sp. AM4]|uniref:hypothetical protein n=1 Tax=Thermococcus sp. (strain AM4) TaxID=246969 RepID=UPI0001870B55|nr:hypothetical protein [Thermococcus sp. AM4]EEB73974.1 hypothetical protein TAM4_262 [Thermococcus sp. AM4]
MGRLLSGIFSFLEGFLIVLTPLTAVAGIILSFLASLFKVWEPRTDGPAFLLGAVSGSAVALFLWGGSWFSLWGFRGLIPLAFVLAVLAGMMHTFLNPRDN